MEDFTSNRNCTPLPLSALQLLVPPVQLVSAVIWQTVQQKAVADYGIVEEFVSMVTDIVPELLSTHQRAQLTLGLRARLILELCQAEATAGFELLQPHLDRVQMLAEAWAMEVGDATAEVPQAGFVDLVKNLLKNPDEKEHFFKDVFPEDFGPAYDEALDTLMGMFLCRLDTFLPRLPLKRVASMFGEVKSVLGECIESVTQHKELKTLLQYQRNLSQLNPNDGSLDDSCIISALKLPSAQRTETDQTEPQTTILNNISSRASDLDKQTSTLPHAIKENQMSQIKVEENVGLLQSTAPDSAVLLKQCRVQLKRLHMPLSQHCRPVRPNRGQRMKKILLEEKRAQRLEALPASKSSSRKTKPSNRRLSEVSHNQESSSFIKHSYMAPINDSSDDDSWSYYSDEATGHKTTSSATDDSWSYYSDEDTGHRTMSSSMDESWSNHSDEECTFVTRVRSFTEDGSLSSSSNQDPPLASRKKTSAARSKRDVPNNKAKTPRMTRKAQCLICMEHIDVSLRTHLKTHFPTGEYACPRCDSRFKLYSSFKQHMRRTCFEYSQQQVDPEKPDKGKNLYKCDKCTQAFRYKVALERHGLTHDDLYCGVCRKVLRDVAMLERHKASHTAFQCNRCEESFTHFKPLFRHYQNVHKIGRPFKCSSCPKVFPKLRLLIAHEWKHTGHLPFQCAQCGMRYRCDADLACHERVHTRERPYLCPECGKTFSQKSNLFRHLHVMHSASRDEKRHSCSECQKSFKEKGALKKHQMSKHLKKLFRHQCTCCGKMVAASSIARHKLIHTGERPFKCTVSECDKLFRSVSEVKRHILVHHSTERPYKCDVCGKGFIKRSFLKLHTKVHTGEKPFVCQICGKAFPKLYSMKRHKKLIHSLVKQ